MRRGVTAFTALLLAAGVAAQPIEDPHVRTYEYYGDDSGCGASFQATHAPDRVFANICGGSGRQLHDYGSRFDPIEPSVVAVSADLAFELLRVGDALIHRDRVSGEQGVVDPAASVERAFLSADGQRVLYTAKGPPALPGTGWAAVEWDAATGQATVVANMYAATAASADLSRVALRPAYVHARWVVRDRTTQQTVEVCGLYACQVSTISPDGRWYVVNATDRRDVHEFGTAATFGAGGYGDPIFRADSAFVAYTAGGAVVIRELATGTVTKPDIGFAWANPSALNSRYLATGSSIVDLDVVQGDGFESGW